MSQFPRSEVEDAFAHFYNLGCVVEDWSGWADLFTDDALYVEHFWGEMHGPAEILAWINPVMAGVPEIYTVLDWYAIDGDKVVWSMQNRRDNPDPAGEPSYFDFPGLSVARYAGDGRWSYEEDYWDVRGARATALGLRRGVQSGPARSRDQDEPTVLARWSALGAPRRSGPAGLVGPRRGHTHHQAGRAACPAGAHSGWAGLIRPQATITKPAELRALLAPIRAGRG